MMARQLDIVADTALREDPRLQPCMVVRQPSQKVTMHGGSSTVDRRVVEIERRRREAGLSQADLCARARIELNNWQKLIRGSHAPSAGTLKKLTAALSSGASPVQPPSVIKAWYRLVMILLAQARGLDGDAVLATDFSVQRPMDRIWREAARIRGFAIYLTAVELQVENVDIAAALACSREAIRKARSKVEDMRDDPEIDGLLERIARQARG